eukprot:212745-Chlamydomonas_euryale.AAC.9
MTRLRTLHAAAAAAEAAATGTCPQPRMCEQPGSYHAGLNHPRGKVAAGPKAAIACQRAGRAGGCQIIRVE